jgi:hypothetical protein
VLRIGDELDFFYLIACFGLRTTGLKRGLGLSSFTISLLIEICMDAGRDVCLDSMLCSLSIANASR